MSRDGRKHARRSWHSPKACQFRVVPGGISEAVGGHGGSPPFEARRGGAAYQLTLEHLEHDGDLANVATNETCRSFVITAVRVDAHGRKMHEDGEQMPSVMALPGGLTLLAFVTHFRSTACTVLCG